MRSPGQIQAKVPEICSRSARGTRIPPKAYGVASGRSATPLETPGESHAAPDPYRTAHRNPAVARPNPSQGTRNLLGGRSRGSRLPPKAYGVASGTSATPLETRGESHAAPDPYRTAHRNHAVARPKSQGATNLFTEPPECHTFCPTPIVLHIDCMKNHNQAVVDLHQQSVAKKTLWPTPIVLRIEQLSAPKP
jgi:hypothetical protein